MSKVASFLAGGTVAGLGYLALSDSLWERATRAREGMRAAQAVVPNAAVMPRLARPPSPLDEIGDVASSATLGAKHMWNAAVVSARSSVVAGLLPAKKESP